MDNSFFLSADFSEPVIWSLRTTTTSSWAWSRAKVPGTAEPLLLELAAGSGFVQIDNREDGTKLDRIVVTNDRGFTPVEPPPLENQQP